MTRVEPDAEVELPLPRDSRFVASGCGNLVRHHIHDIVRRERGKAMHIEYSDEHCSIDVRSFDSDKTYFGANPRINNEFCSI